MLSTQNVVPLAVRRFVRYSIVGVGTFAFDLLLLFIKIDVFGVNYLVATATSFLIAVTANYFISRHFVFVGTRRSIQKGLLYFLVFAGVGSVAITGTMWALTLLTDLNVYLVRILVAGMVGCINYLLNLYLNFKFTNQEL